MELPEIKREPGSPSQLKFDASNATALTSDTDTATNLNTTIPLWRDCTGKTRAEKVSINEEAAEHAKVYFQAASNTLAEFLHVNLAQSLLNEMSKFPHRTASTHASLTFALQLLVLLLIRGTESTLQRKQECKKSIGFLGGTGTGKSSLINALLKEKVLPKSDEHASTAVPVEVSYNYSDDPSKKYRVVIEGISRAEFTKEIENLFEDKYTWDNRTELEKKDPDYDLLQGINDTFEKIKCLYPQLQELSDLDKTSAEMLLSHPAVVRLLDSKQQFVSDCLESFASVVKNYIEANSAKDEAACPTARISVWPLVKVVKIFTKADLLRRGITLVDLPGNLDTSAARVAVTENYRRNLTMTVVVAPAVRASSDKGAHELLSTAERRTMQLDGVYKSESLFFVVSKIDDLEDYEAYIKAHPNMKARCAERLRIIQDMDGQIKKLELESKSKEKVLQKYKTAIQTAKEAHAQLTPQVENILNALTPVGQKRKRAEDIEGTLEQIMPQ